MNPKLKEIYDRCWTQLGGEKNQDLQWVLKRRAKSITRKSFFEQVVWAIWVSGKGRKQADSFLDRAADIGFPYPYDFNHVASWTEPRFRRFVEKLHGHPVPEGAYKRWLAIRSIAQRLCKYSSEKAFRAALFGGKVRSADLDHNDANALAAMRLPWIGETNASFIIRNMGGEDTKDDRWLKEFRKYNRISHDELNKRLRRSSIQPGVFDGVLWAYCEKFIRRVNGFTEHFDRVFNSR